MKRIRRIFLLQMLLALALLARPSLAQDAPAASLLMFERDNCEWCEIWWAEVGDAYAKTWEGKIAPLRRVDIDDPLPQDLQDIRVERFTPTFVLLVAGQESGRIRGYPGEDFFWGLLDQMLAQAGYAEPNT